MPAAATAGVSAAAPANAAAAAEVLHHCRHETEGGQVPKLTNSHFLVLTLVLFSRILRESVHFRSLCRRFNWRLAAAKYIFRKQTMEDYLAVYIHALAAYRWGHQDKESNLNKFAEFLFFCRLRSSTTDSAWDSEPVETLAQRLIVLSESCPEDLAEIMAPSISGVVYNQAAAASGGNGGGGGGAGMNGKSTWLTVF